MAEIKWRIFMAAPAAAGTVARIPSQVSKLATRRIETLVFGQVIRAISRVVEPLR